MAKPEKEKTAPVKKTAELLQQFSGPPRFGKRSLICIQSNRGTSETQEVFSLNLKNRRDHILKVSIYKNYDELPLMLNMKQLADLLGISDASAYELIQEDGFPALRIGKRIVVPKEDLRNWISARTKGVQK